MTRVPPCPVGVIGQHFLSVLLENIRWTKQLFIGDCRCMPTAPVMPPAPDTVPSPATAPRGRRGAVTAAGKPGRLPGISILLVLGSCSSLQAGAALAMRLFPVLGAPGAT